MISIPSSSSSSSSSSSLSSSSSISSSFTYVSKLLYITTEYITYPFYFKTKNNNSSPKPTENTENKNKFKIKVFLDIIPEEDSTMYTSVENFIRHHEFVVQNKHSSEDHQSVPVILYRSNDRIAIEELVKYSSTTTTDSKQMVLLITNNTSLDTIKNIYQIKDTSKIFNIYPPYINIYIYSYC